MLTELIIRNFAIIDRLQLSFGPGLSVLTGETGAGKSIIIDAVGLLLGDRARPELIRTGEEEAVVEALFDISENPHLREEIAGAGFEASDELLVRRIVSRSGKNRVYLNGSLARLAQLAPLTSSLTTIYGQHEHQRLQRTETHLALLDQFAGLEAQVDAYRALYRETADLKERLKNLEEAEREHRRRADLLAFQCREIDEAQLSPGEDEALADERLLLLNAERLSAATAGGYDKLYGEQGAVCETLEEIAAALEPLAPVDGTLGELAESVRSSLYALEDVARRLRDYSGRITFEPERQGEVEGRLAQISSLKRKYAPTLQEIIDYRQAIEEELAEIGDFDSLRGKLQQSIAAADERLLAAGKELSAKRIKGAGELASSVESELKDLALEKARFEMRLFPLPEPGPGGLERAEFYLAPNPGEEPRPLAWIASGGELSRIMLALQRAAPGAEKIPTLIFDEVDAGIGGAAATAVGEKLRRVAAGPQVLCITHLPQVAAFADRHYRVEKREEAGRTFTAVVLLNQEERVKEMARLLGGAKVTERTLEHAREIIAQSSVAIGDDSRSASVPIPAPLSSLESP